MSVAKKDVEHVTNLARLGISEEEKELLTKQLSAILEYANNLKELDTKDILPTSHAIPLKIILREDKNIPSKNGEDILENAPEEKGHMFRVPKIIE